MARVNRRHGRRLGIDWGSLRLKAMREYSGTVKGLKNNVSRANRVHSPKRFTWERIGKKLYVWRTA